MHKRAILVAYAPYTRIRRWTTTYKRETNNIFNFNKTTENLLRIGKIKLLLGFRRFHIASSHSDAPTPNIKNRKNKFADK
jgi:hypothetical protein